MLLETSAVVATICRQVQWNGLVGICEEIQLQQRLVAAFRTSFTWITRERQRICAVFKFIVTVFLHCVSICKWLFYCKPLVSKVLQFYAKLSCSDAIIKSQQIFIKLFHSSRWHLTKVSWVKKWEIGIQRWRCSINPLFDSFRIVSTMLLYTSMRYFLTRTEADETSPMGNWSAIGLWRLCHRIGRDSSTTRSTSVLLSWSGWSFSPVNKLCSWIITNFEIIPFLLRIIYWLTNRTVHSQ